VEDGVAQDPDGRDGINLLPEHVAGVVVGAQVLATGLPQPQQRLRAVDDEAGMHLDGDLDAVVRRELDALAPVGNDLLLPLPGQQLLEVRRPGSRDPVGVLGVVAVARAAREVNHHRHAQFLRQQNRLAIDFAIAFGDLAHRVQRLAVAAQRADREAVVAISFWKASSSAGLSSMESLQWGSPG
jgi:hypothetical protein